MSWPPSCRAPGLGFGLEEPWCTLLPFPLPRIRWAITFSLGNNMARVFVLVRVKGEGSETNCECRVRPPEKVKPMTYPGHKAIGSPPLVGSEIKLFAFTFGGGWVTICPSLRNVNSTRASPSCPRCIPAPCQAQSVNRGMDVRGCWHQSSLLPFMACSCGASQTEPLGD